MQYYALIDGEKRGPFNAEYLLRIEEVTPDTLVWEPKKSVENAKKIRDVPTLVAIGRFPDIEMPSVALVDDNENVGGTVSIHSVEYGEGPVAVLKIFAWLDMIVGVIGFISFAIIHGSFGNVVGITFLLQGILLWALFIVVASIADNTIAIRRKLESAQSQ